MSSDNTKHMQPLYDANLKAEGLARAYQHGIMTCEHICYAILDLADEKTCKAFENMKVSVEDFKMKLADYFSDTNYFFSGNLQTIIPSSVVAAVNKESTIHFIAQGRDVELSFVFARAFALAGNGSVLHSVASNIGFDILEFKRQVAKQTPHPSNNTMPDLRELTGGQPSGSALPEKVDESNAQEVIDQFCVNLNVEAENARIDPLIGREKEVDRLVQVLARRTKNNVVLTGEPGVGKTAIAQGFAHKVVHGNVPNIFKDVTVYSLDINSLLAGTKYRGDFEQRVEKIVEAIKLIGNIVLFVDEVHKLMGAGTSSDSANDAANMLKPALAAGTLRCIGATTNTEYRKHIEKDAALTRRFQRIDVVEPSVEDTIKILHGLKEYYEKFHNVTFTDEAIKAAVELSKRHLTQLFLPDKAIDIMDIAGARMRITDDAESREINQEMIETELAKIAKIPEQTVKSSDAEKLSLLESAMKDKVFGQDSAIDKVCDSIHIARSGLRDENKSSGAYLFLGPTGVGKTEVCVALSKTLDVKLVRFDMSEFMERHSVSTLLGSPPGYVGYNDGTAGSGLLINALEANPHCVLLFDEIEKAHPDVYNIFLQLLDNGSITSTDGKTVSARHAVIVFTSNCGITEGAKKRPGFKQETESSFDESAMMEIVNKKFKPEFRNRLDDIIVFNSLSEEVILKVVDKFLKKLDEQCATKNVTLTVTDEAKKWLAKEGFEPEFGARPLSRKIDTSIKRQLSKMMLFGDLKDGGDAVADVEDDKIVISKR